MRGSEKGLTDEASLPSCHIQLLDRRENKAGERTGQQPLPSAPFLKAGYCWFSKKSISETLSPSLHQVHGHHLSALAPLLGRKERRGQQIMVAGPSPWARHYLENQGRLGEPVTLYPSSPYPYLLSCCSARGRR